MRAIAAVVYRCPARVRHFTELPSLDPSLELLSDSGICGFSHAARKRGFKDRAAVLHCPSLEDMIAGPSHGPLRLHLRVLHPILTMFARLGDYAVRLVPIPCRQLAVPL